MAKRLRRECACGRMVAQNADGELYPHIHNAGYVEPFVDEAAVARSQAAADALEARAARLNAPEPSDDSVGLGWELLALALNTLERSGEEPTPYTDRICVGVRGDNGHVWFDDDNGQVWRSAK